MASESPPSWWPEGQETTPPSDRKSGRFQKNLHPSQRHAIKQLEMQDAREIVAYVERGQSVSFPGVALKWKLNGSPYVLACDTYDSRSENMRAVGMTLEYQRKIVDYGAVTASEAYEGLEALPSSGEVTPERGPGGTVEMTKQAALEALNFDPSKFHYSRDINARFKRLAKTYHPDGSDPDELRYKEIQQAKAVLLDD